MPLIVGINASKEFALNNNEEFINQYPNHIFVFLDESTLKCKDEKILKNLKKNLPSFNNLYQKLK